MPGLARRARFVVCLGWLCAGALAGAPAPLGAQQVTDLDDVNAIAAWRERLEDGRARLAEARQRADAAHDAYADWRQRKVPRGVRKEKLVREVTEAEAELAEAQKAWQVLFEEARRAGVPPGVLRDFE
jgi:malate synthase